jgi:hypothetical protein
MSRARFHFGAAARGDREIRMPIGAREVMRIAPARSEAGVRQRSEKYFFRGLRNRSYG